MAKNSLQQPQLVVALDVPDLREALALAAVLKPATPWMKVGLELFTAAGPAAVEALKKLGCSVFLDLKFHDIPNTVRGAVKSAFRCGADICDIHLEGGPDMAEAAAKAAQEARAAGGKCLLLGVTVLTSSSGRDLPGSVRDLVVERAQNAKACGLDGVVCSGHEAAAVKQSCGSGFICLCPGIRLPEGPGAAQDDQSRVMTPREAVLQGADFLVVGRPITRSADPALTAGEVIKNMREPALLLNTQHTI